MKKLIFVLAGILLFIYLILSLLSFRGDYCAQKELWGINRRLDFIASHQESTPDYTINQMSNRYQVFIKKYKGSIFARQALLMMGDLYAFRKNFPQARLEYQKALGPDQELSAQAQLAIARTYEAQGRWDKAREIYKGIIENYPITDSGFSMPMYLAGHDGSYADALRFYQGIAAQYPKSKLEYSALRMIAICQLAQKDWPGTVKTMGTIILKYPVGQAIQEAVKAINVICVTKLHDYDMGINIYTQFIQKYPDHPADPILKKMIKDLQILKNKKLIIKSKGEMS